MYQASFLLRDYDFDFEELPFSMDGNLRTESDPKMIWAKDNLAGSPVDITKADFEQLIRVPGIGKINAKKILEERTKQGISKIQDLGRIGISMNRCAPFILIHGKMPAYQPDLWI